MIKIRIPAKRSKYNVDRSDMGKLARTYKDVVYDSAAEARYAVHLDGQIKAGNIHSWTRQQRGPLVVNGFKICDMVIDFAVYEKKGCVPTPVEVKGVETAAWKIKRKLYEAIFGVTIRVVNAKDVR